MAVALPGVMRHNGIIKHTRIMYHAGMTHVFLYGSYPEMEDNFHSLIHLCRAESFFSHLHPRTPFRAIAPLTTASRGIFLR